MSSHANISRRMDGQDGDSRKMGVTVVIDPSQSYTTECRDGIIHACRVAHGFAESKINNVILPQADDNVEETLAHPAVQKTAVTRDGAYALYFYACDDFYKPLNALLRKRDTAALQPYAVILFHLDVALRAVQQVTNGTVYRGLGCRLTEVSSRYRKGATVCWSGLSSTSLSRAVALQDFSGSGGTLVKIRGVNAAHVALFSPFPEEEEVLLPPNTFVKVAQVFDSDEVKEFANDQSLPDKMDLVLADFNKTPLYATYQVVTTAVAACIQRLETAAGENDAPTWRVLAAELATGNATVTIGGQVWDASSAESRANELDPRAPPSPPPRELPQVIVELIENGTLSKDCKHVNISESSGVNDAAVIAVAEHCSELSRLEFREENDTISDAAIIAVAEHCKQLEHLDVSCTNGKITDAAILAVAQHCPQLQHLNISCKYLAYSAEGTTGIFITDKALTAVVVSCRQLTHLDVSRGVVTDASIIAVADFCDGLRHLDVSDTESITDAAIVTVAERCSQLRHLDVSCTRKITDVAIAEVAERCPCLEHLGVSKTSGKITDAAIVIVAKKCTQLQHLDVSESRGKITDVAIVAVAQHCGQLEHLNVHSTEDKITDIGIISVAERCPKLKHLDVSINYGTVTDAAIDAMAKHCRQLEFLCVSTCAGGITEKVLERIRKEVGAKVEDVEFAILEDDDYW